MTTANDDQAQARNGSRIGGGVTGLFRIENAQQTTMLFVPGKRQQIRIRHIPLTHKHPAGLLQPGICQKGKGNYSATAADGTGGIDT